MNCRKCHKEIPDKSKFCLYCGVVQNVSNKTKMRGNGTGSVYKRGKTWMATRVVQFTVDGDKKVHRKTINKSGFKTKKEALEYLPTLFSTKAEVKNSVRWKDLYDMWFPTHRAGKSTMDCYASAEKYFEPVYYMKISEIDIDDLQECLDECPHGKRTRQNMKALAGLLYKYAIPRHMVSLNLGQYLIVTAESTCGKQALPESALEAIRSSAWAVPGADYVLCQCYLGFRPSEFIDLEISDYNQKERAFSGGAKTEAGKNRIVTVSPKIQPFIDKLVAGKTSGPVFCNEDGSRMTIEQYRSLFYSVLDACGIDNPIEGEGETKRHRYTPHSCRHTFATLMKRVSAADKDKLELIGHTSAEMLRHYQDVSFEDLRKVTDSI